MNTAHKISFEEEENYYELLRVSTTSTTAEIVTAYHAARNAFAKDSVATYSLFEESDSLDILAKLEEAYLTLSSVEKRRAYDRKLGAPITPEVTMSEQFESPIKNTPITESNPTLKIPTPNEIVASPNSPSEGAAENNFPTTIALAEIRNSRGLSLEDVARITKIPPKYLKAIEDFDLKNLPAKVYIQGFLKNLSQLYKLDPKETVKLYLEQLDKITPTKQN